MSAPHYSHNQRQGAAFGLSFRAWLLMMIGYQRAHAPPYWRDVAGAASLVMPRA